jgi:predicted nuclease of restriction endonuclease-like (RecB) superfamily
MLQHNQYQQLITSITASLEQGRRQAVQRVNSVLVQTYWHIGKHIVEFEQQGNEKAEYGYKVLKQMDKIRAKPKDPYVFEFLDLPERNYRESELENSLIEKLEHFLLELGKGFAFIGQQYRITLDNTHFYVDLVFYHRILKCFVLIDLKTRKVKHHDIGQMNMYLNYFKAEENVADDNDPIGIVLATDKDEIMVEYATGSISNQLFVSKYQLYLPDVDLLRTQLQHLLDEQEQQA